MTPSCEVCGRFDEKTAKQYVAECEAIYIERDRLRAERDAARAEVERLQAQWQPEEIRLAEAKAEALWLELGDAESFAREAKAKDELWRKAQAELSALRAENERMKSELAAIETINQASLAQVERLRRVLEGHGLLGN